jgi:gamma-glutamyl hercynylcysteine S-oxide synthase
MIGQSFKQMIIIPAGILLRGSPHSPDEQPVNEVTLNQFSIDKYPVSNRQFQDFVDSGGYSDRSFWTELGWDFIQQNKIHLPNYWSDPHWNQVNHPVTGVSWWEALAFANFSGKTLPTEAQWEYACKGKDQRAYPWGDDFPDASYANFAPDCDPLELNRSSTPVDYYPKNQSYFGCLDMAGNLAEWCLDNASTNYSWDAIRNNPIYITSEKDYHTVRGGCGLHNEEFLRCTSRDNYPPSLRDNLVGFRCVINHIS